jgi:hypothetical protein
MPEKNQVSLLKTTITEISAKQDKQKTVESVSTPESIQLANYTSNASPKNSISKGSSSQSGCFCRLFCCMSSPEEEEQRIIKKKITFYQSKRKTYEQRILRELGKSPEAIENRKALLKIIFPVFEEALIALMCAYDNDFKLMIGMAILGKITTNEGDSILTYIGTEIAQLLHYEIPDLLTQDISFLFAHPEFAKKHKEFLARFIDTARSPSERNKDNKSPFLVTAPRGIRQFLLRNGDGHQVKASFELKTFAIRRTELSQEEQELRGVYTLAQFYSVNEKSEQNEEKHNLSTKVFSGDSF